MADATPPDTLQAIEDALEATGGAWAEDVEGGRPMLTGFYVFATFANAEGYDITFALSSDGNGGSPREWTVRGWLDYACDRGLYGIEETE